MTSTLSVAPLSLFAVKEIGPQRGRVGKRGREERFCLRSDLKIEDLIGSLGSDFRGQKSESSGLSNDLGQRITEHSDI